jgi:hypothetical protein
VITLELLTVYLAPVRVATDVNVVRLRGLTIHRTIESRARGIAECWPQPLVNEQS